jgi:hypothetical protein
MRKALIGILMAATAAMPALAQNDDRGHDRGQHSQPQRQPQQRQQGQRQAGGNRGAVQQPRQFQQQRFQGRQFQPQAQPQQQERNLGARPGGFQGRQFQPQAQPRQQERNLGARPGGFQGDRGVNRQGFQGESYRRAPAQGDFAPQRSREQRQEWKGNRGTWRGEGARGGGRWDRGWRNSGRYDWQRYRYANRGTFHLGPYYAPYRGYYYNPLEIGIVLDSLFYDRNYWIDPGYYDLPPAPPGAEWVRYYNDVVLVDMDSGEVLDVIHDFFW